MNSSCCRTFTCSESLAGEDRRNLGGGEQPREGALPSSPLPATTHLLGLAIPSFEEEGHPDSCPSESSSFPSSLCRGPLSVYLMRVWPKSCMSVFCLSSRSMFSGTCFVHSGASCDVPTIRPDLFVCGFVCKGNSVLNPARYSQDRVRVKKLSTHGGILCSCGRSGENGATGKQACERCVPPPPRAQRGGLLEAV
jgi:hypothetical protein